MRLPHITIEYREEETYALESISLPLLLGFSIHWALMFLLALNDAVQFFPLHGSAATLFLQLFFAATTVVLFLYAFFLKGARRLFSTPKMRWRNRLIGACLMELALLLMLIPSHETLQVCCMALSGIFAGVGSAILTMSFGVSSSVCDLPAVVISIATSMPLGAGILALVLLIHSYAPIVAIIICLTFPFLELIGLNVSSTKLIDNLEFIGLTIPVNTRDLAFRLITPGLLLGFMIGIARLRLSQHLTNMPNSFDTIIPLILAGLCMGVALLAAMFTQRKAHNFAFRTLIPIATLSLALLAMPPFDQPAFQMFSIFLCFLILMGCIWILCSDVSQRFRISAFSTFGFGYGALLLGAFVAVMLAAPNQPFEAITADNTAFFAAALVCITWGTATLPRNSELLRTLKRGRTCPAFSEDVLLEETPLVNRGDELVTFSTACESEGVTPKEAAPQATSTQMQTERTKVTVAEKPLNPTPQETPAATSDNSAKKDPSNPPALDLNRCENSTFSPRSKRTNEVDKPPYSDTYTQETQGSISPDVNNANPSLPLANAHADETIADLEELELKRNSAGRFKRKCAAVANMFLLSRKETEVLYLLARGRNSATIQESLYISAGTANTHMRHIYRKLDVHSQRELIDLVESIDPGPDVE